ncbi:MAG: CoA pyrophosphatase [Planctomycetes bacterium]|nr:CoA pyrophosphatase [Planctomycetota bacterium]
MSASPSWEELSASLALRPARKIRFPGLRRASVLVPLFRDDQGDLHALFTRRPASLRHHAGQVSFPGGRLEPDEQPWEGALREAEEELGIPPDQVSRLGALSEIPIHASGHRMLPFVGRIPPDLELRPNPAEVDRAFSVPLRALVDPSATRYTRRPRLFQGTSYSIPYFEWEDELIWGATGGVVVELLEVCGLADALKAALKAGQG